jgi:hypothetical protein
MLTSAQMMRANGIVGAQEVPRYLNNGGHRPYERNLHQLPVIETQPSTVSNASRLDVPSVDRELNEIWRQALIDKQSADHAFVSCRVT